MSEELGSSLEETAAVSQEARPDGQLYAGRERPILFSAPMVQALRAGRKTQTRRIVKPQPVVDGHGFWSWSPHRAQGLYHGQGGSLKDLAETLPQYSPYGVPGDRLWVREAWSAEWSWRHEKPRDIIPAAPIWYWADGNPTDRDWTRPKPSIHMPRWASRLTLTITDVRVERLQDISEGDAIAEGLEWVVPGVWSVASSIPAVSHDPREVYFQLWDLINGPDAADANPWVWAVSFSVDDQSASERSDAAQVEVTDPGTTQKDFLK